MRHRESRSARPKSLQQSSTRSPRSRSRSSPPPTATLRSDRGGSDGAEGDPRWPPSTAAEGHPRSHCDRARRMGVTERSRSIVRSPHPIRHAGGGAPINSRVVAAWGSLVQLVPLAFLAIFLFILSMPVDAPSGQPGVAEYRATGTWYVFALTIALGLAGLLATVSRTAATVAALLTVGTLAYGLRLWLPGVNSNLVSFVGKFVVALSVVSIAGAALRFLAWRRAAKSQLSGQP
jgi:hypothetical protein